MIDLHKFSHTRETSLEMWIKGTKRDCSSVNDDFSNSFECKWQNMALALTDDFDYKHISIFCGLGEWASNISDILKNSSYDHYDFQNEDQRQALFRYYTRFLLVTSEILVDFQDIVIFVENCDNTESRQKLSTNKVTFDIDSLFGFINSLCKHKVNKIHRCNHHLPIHFEDFPLSNSFSDPFSVDNINFENPDPKKPDCILMPKLSDLIQIILGCYDYIDCLFTNDTSKFRRICRKYGMFTDEMIEGNDVQLEEDRWLIWIDISDPCKNTPDIDSRKDTPDIDSRKDTPDIDSLIIPTENFWKQIEIHGVSENLGLDAFNFLPDSIRNAVKASEANELYRLFDQMKSRIQNHKSDILMSARLNNLFHKDFFVELLEHILRNIDVIRSK